MKAHDRSEFAAQLVTDPFIEILGPENSIHMVLKSPDFRSPKLRGNPVIGHLENLEKSGNFQSDTWNFMNNKVYL